MANTLIQNTPWITIIGLNEDGLDGLPPASRLPLDTAEIIMGPPRHLALLPKTQAQQIEWPAPFAHGIEQLKTLRGQKVVVLASGDPFWFGAGAVIARHFTPDEWICLSAPSCFSIAASRMGWALEKTICLGLHAAPFTRLRPHVANGVNMIVTLRDGDAVIGLKDYLNSLGIGKSIITVLEHLSGPQERITQASALTLEGDFSHPLVAAIQIIGDGATLPRCNGLPDDVFISDGVMTKRPIRALTLSALAPRPFETLWDIGGGSGSIALEWLLAETSCQAVTIEPRADRLGFIASNAAALGVDRLQIIQGTAPDALHDLPTPDAIFIGGGLSDNMIHTLESIAKGTRIVANAVTLEGESLLSRLQAEKGGDLMRIDLSHATPLGRKHGWKAAYPVVQWSGVL